MADKPYKVYFNWSGSGLDTGKLQLVSSDVDGTPWEGKYWNPCKSLLNQYEQLWKGEAQKAALAANKANTLKLPRSRFLYMDIGCWLKGKQTFGLVWKDQAIVCSYMPGQASSAEGTQSNLIDRFKQSVPGVSIVGTRETIEGSHPDESKLYIFVPDMHIPGAPPLSVPRPSETLSEKIDTFLFGSNTQGHYSQDPNEWDRLSKHDLFDSRQSIDAMVSFLGAINGLSWAEKIVFVQIGDMYELWAARPCLLAKTPDENPDIEIVANSDEGYQTVEQSIEAIALWIGDTHIIYPDLFCAIDALRVGTKIFLYGNHDSYLTDERVVAAASRYIQENFEMFRSRSSKVYSRAKDGLMDGIFFEHGMRFDGENRDGQTSGFKMANRTANHPWIGSVMKEFDATRRETFVTGAAAYWLGNGANFGLYVQGHTHDPVLRYVEVYNRRLDTNVVYGPAGPMVVTSTQAIQTGGASGSW